MSDAPKVVVNTISVSSGAYVREINLLKRLPTGDVKYEVLCSDETAEKLDGTSRNVHLNRVSSIENSLRRPAGTAKRLLWDNVSLPRWVRHLGGDLLYFPLQMTNLVDVAPKVIAVHNAAPFYPEVQPNRPLSESIRLWALRRATGRSIRQAQRVIFFTETTLKRVADQFPAVREKGTVIPHGVPDNFAPKDPDPSIIERYDLPETFLLSVSNIARYKNQRELLEGYAAADDRVEMPQLCLAGKTVDDDYGEELSSCIDDLGIDEKVHRLGFVDHDDIPDLHAASEGFVFSSACENAPITLIEALACGTPIACSNATSMPEICGDAAMYFDPFEPGDIADTLVRFVTEDETRRSLVSSAVDRADRYSWERAARETHEVFTDVIEMNSHGSRTSVASSSSGCRETDNL